MSIISPWTFYLISLVEGVSTFFFVTFALCLIGAAFTALIYLHSPDCETEKAVKKWFKRFAIGTVISLIMIIVIPSKETCYQMLAAKMVTYENVGLAVRKIEEIALFLMNGAK